ncbi:adsorption protein B [Novosphingobium kunmingense]|uniref:Adsorption protein B n=1 Tax=Novosphingobium kunmingense TaxID=1211806 RepID=A0A2N0HKI9_9SPHN|nr:glycosyl transferase family protein [Novosphingobium kunmingense]PKB19471.1 adsorption protein B [Novosphingobium kunmingense]
MGENMVSAETAWAAAVQVLVPIERELLVFAAFWFVVGLVDEFAVDLTWLWLRLTGRARTPALPRGYGAAPLAGPIAVFVPAFEEAGVIATTVRHMAGAWPQDQVRFYIGCYGNDPATLEAAMAGATGDPRVRLVINGAAGPTTKADCLNRLYAALSCDERRSLTPFRGVVLQDAEDMVHPAALQVIDTALGAYDFVQLPVRPALQPDSRWVAGHYADEFTEAHAKALVVRSVVGAAIPAAGVGCGFAREALGRLVRERGGDGPFATECLTEDYELGMMLSREGRGSTFLRLRDAEGDLVATSSYFPAELSTAVRQKTRWVHGIAFQGWDRMGWSARPLELWMALRDRRGPLTAIVLFAAYALLAIEALLLLAARQGFVRPEPHSTALQAMLALSMAGFVWRLASRAVFTAREYGLAEGALAMLRMPVANIIAIMAGRRALVAYVRSLSGGAVTWDKTAHHGHPALVAPMRPAGEGARS